MIWNKDILFIHAPKTAGMSMTTLLLNSLKGEVFVTGPFDKQYKENNVVYIPGKRHETLYDAESFFTYRNMSIFQFKKIFSVMRNPYDLELSRYSYLRKDLPQDRGPAQKIALDNSFKGYLKSAPFFGMNPPRLHLYYSFNNTLLDQLIVLKFEQLNSDIEQYLSPYLEENYNLPYENKSKHDAYIDVYDEEMEETCYLRNRWFFEKGFYSRLKDKTEK